MRQYSNVNLLHNLRISYSHFECTPFLACCIGRFDGILSRQYAMNKRMLFFVCFLLSQTFIFFYYYFFFTQTDEPNNFVVGWEWIMNFARYD